jgi:hypothetical protein
LPETVFEEVVSEGVGVAVVAACLVAFAACGAFVAGVDDVVEVEEGGGGGGEAVAGIAVQDVGVLTLAAS